MVIGSLLRMQDESVVVGQRQRIGGQFIELWVLETKGRLHVAPHSLLTEKIGDVIGAKRAGSMGLGYRGRHGVGSI